MITIFVCLKECDCRKEHNYTVALCTIIPDWTIPLLLDAPETLGCKSVPPVIPKGVVAIVCFTVVSKN